MTTSIPHNGTNLQFCPTCGKPKRPNFSGHRYGGWEFVQGIEMNAEYVRISEARIKFWKMNSGLFESLTEDEDDAPIDAQETLF